jgi:hypothetical protein
MLGWLRRRKRRAANLNAEVAARGQRREPTSEESGSAGGVIHEVMLDVGQLHARQQLELVAQNDGELESVPESTETHIERFFLLGAFEEATYAYDLATPPEDRAYLHLMHWLVEVDGHGLGDARQIVADMRWERSHGNVQNALETIHEYGCRAMRERQRTDHLLAVYRIIAAA